MDEDKPCNVSMYKYDVFICYAFEDRGWVNKLVSLLEASPYKLKCCIHERDFETGKTTLDNIGKRLVGSRKFMLVISNAFNNSKWCEYERDQILGLSIEEKERMVIPVVLEECSIPQSICHITYASVSLDFTQNWFDKITLALDVKAIVCSVCSEEGVVRKGNTRCPDCEASFCLECNKQHSRMPISRNHRIATVHVKSETEEMVAVKEEWSELQNSQFKVMILAKRRRSDDTETVLKENIMLNQHLKDIERRLEELEAKKTGHYYGEGVLGCFPVDVTGLNHKLGAAEAYPSHYSKKQVSLPVFTSSGGERAEARVSPIGIISGISVKTSK